MDVEQLDVWFSREKRRSFGELLRKRLGLTRTRAECFLRLWVYLLIKEKQQLKTPLRPPLLQLELLQDAVSCTQREAAELFYSDQDRGSERAAGMMLDKLAALRLIKKSFDGNTTLMEILPISEVFAPSQPPETSISLTIDEFNPRCDAIPVANLLATNYSWMNRSSPNCHRIAQLLRNWSSQYAQGMRVLRRCDNLNPVGFYLLYPTQSKSDINFFSLPAKNLHLSSADTEIDPFSMAKPGDKDCLSVFIRSWMIDSPYLSDYRVYLIEDVQKILTQMLNDFPNLCDLYTLIIHPIYEQMAHNLGFQKTGQNSQTSIYWMYVSLDRFLSLDVQAILA